MYHHLSKARRWQLLEALRAALADLEQIRTINQDDPAVLELKQSLRDKIAEIERSERMASD